MDFHRNNQEMEDAGSQSSEDNFLNFDSEITNEADGEPSQHEEENDLEDGKHDDDNGKIDD